MKIVKKKISDLIFSEYNPRKLTDKEEQDLTDSIKRFGIVDPIIINKHPDRKNIVIGGHQRIKVALKLEYKEIPCVEVEMDRDRERELNIRLNKNNGSWDWDLLEDNFELEELIDWGFEEEELDFDIEEEVLESENIDKDIGDIKILNLYAGIGGNRKFWGDLDVTAVEYNEEIARAYQDFFPNDKVIVEDAHKYLEEHFNEFDFIWSSPPCPTHSRIRKNGVGGTIEKMERGMKAVYPDMKLYEEILFLQGYFKGKYVIENVKSWYDPLIEPQERGRHYYWSNFDIPKEGFPAIIEGVGQFQTFNVEEHQKKFDYNLDKYTFSSDYPKEKILKNMVHPKTGEYILKCAYKEQKAEKIG